MQEPITYHLDHATSTVDISLGAGRLVVKTQGKGALDKLRTIDIAVGDLLKFSVVPTIGVQNVSGGRLSDAPDTSYDSEFIFSYSEEGKVMHKRMFVAREDAAFKRLI